MMADEEVEKSVASSSTLPTPLELSPFQYQIKNKKVSDQSEDAKVNLCCKFELAKEEFIKKIAEAVAPTQATELI